MIRVDSELSLLGDKLFNIVATPVGVAMHRVNYEKQATLEAAISARVEFLSRVRKSIIMAEDEMDPEIFRDSRIVAAIHTILERGVNVEIVHGPNVDPVTLDIYRQLEEQFPNINLFPEHKEIDNVLGV